MNWDELLPLLTLLTSLVAAAVIYALPEERVRARTAVNLSGAILKLVCIAVMLWGVAGGHRYEFRFPVLPGIDFALRADALAMFFVTLSGVLWFLTTVYAIAYLEGAPQRRRFFAFFSVCVSATVGIALARNLFTFVMFYELLTLSTYPLVVHRETDASLRAGRVYLAYTLGGGAVLLFAAAWLHALVPSVEFNGGASLAVVSGKQHSVLRVIFALLIAGLGVKGALVPLHSWLPRAMVAPAPVSALLHAVAVVKAGAFGIVRVVYDVYGIDFTHALGLTTPLAVLASATIVYGSLRALVQDDLKRRLAYSTVSQVSYIALGVAVVGPSATIGGVVHLVHQGLMKITLFFCAGNLAETLGIHNISEMDGVGRRMPWTMAAFTAAALGMIGVPPLAGFISKWYLGMGAIEAGQYWVLLVLAASTALNAAYFLPILYVAWFREPHGDWVESAPRRSLETSWGLLLPPLATGTLSVFTGLLAGAPFNPLPWAALIAERAYGRIVIWPGLVGGAAPPSFAAALLMLLTLAAPVVLTCALLRPQPGRLTLWLASLAATPAVVLAVCCRPGVMVDLPWLLFHSRLGLDETGRVFLLCTALLWLCATIYARGYLAGDPRVRRFFLFFLPAMAGNFGLVLAQDMASFYFFFALMSFAAYGLVVHRGDAEATRAGRVYMVLVVIGEIALFAGMLLATDARGSLLFEADAARFAAAPARHVVLGLLLVGFGIKAGLVPLHVWLPLAHPAAPVPASAVLSGAMIKAGLLGWLRFAPVGTAGFAGWGDVWLALGIVTALLGVIAGVGQSNAKTVLAYSSISQMGLLALGIGGGLLVPAAWPTLSGAVLLYASHHALSKGCLFLGVGVAGGAWRIGWQRRLVQAGLLLPALAMAGAPLTVGALGKTALKEALAPLPEHWTAVLNLVLPLAAVGTTLLMARFLWLTWPAAQNDAARPAPAVLCSWGAAVFFVAAAAWLTPGLAGGETSVNLAATLKWANAVPLLIGGLLAWGAGRAGPALPGRGRLPAISPGDVLAVWPPTARGLSAGVQRLNQMTSVRRLQARRLPGVFVESLRWRRLAEAAETRLARWPWAGGALWVVLTAACAASIVL